MYRLRVYSMRYFNSANKQQWSDGREHIAQAILNLCQKKARTLTKLVSIAEQITELMDKFGWSGDICIQLEGKTCVYTQYQITVRNI